jgi:hypothetical protein
LKNDTNSSFIHLIFQIYYWICGTNIGFHKFYGEFETWLYGDNRRWVWKSNAIRMTHVYLKLTWFLKLPLNMWYILLLNFDQIIILKAKSILRWLNKDMSYPYSITQVRHKCVTCAYINLWVKYIFAPCSLKILFFVLMLHFVSQIIIVWYIVYDQR